MNRDQLLDKIEQIQNTSIGQSQTNKIADLIEQEYYTKLQLEQAIMFGIDLECGDVTRNFKKYSLCVDQFIQTVLKQTK